MAPTQAALYDDLAGDLHLSWSEAELPERERTKHVHRLHPYLGKFVPQLVEALLLRYVKPGGRVLDPFAGSGTTLVQCLESGYDAVGVDIAAFNCLLMRVKTPSTTPSGWNPMCGARSSVAAAHAGGRTAVGEWFAPQAAAELLDFRSLLDGTHGDVLRVVLARAARSARLTTHLTSNCGLRSASRTGATNTAEPAHPCRRRTSLRRYLVDTLERLKAFQRVRARGRSAEIVHGDAPSSSSKGHSTRSVAALSGLIDYHEQHRYAYEILGLDDRRERELVRRPRVRAAAPSRTTAGISAVWPLLERLADGAPVLVVVNDRRDLYRRSSSEAGSSRRAARAPRQSRTGRRAGEYFESILVCVRET